MRNSEFHQEIERLRQVYIDRDERAMDRSEVDDYYDARRAEVRAELLGPRLQQSKAILDIGCGHGVWLKGLKEQGVRESSLFGFDISWTRLQAAERLLPEAHFDIGCATELEYEEGAFDGVILSLVFSSIFDHAMQAAVLDEAWRVLAPGGWLLIHDMTFTSRSGDARAFRWKDLKSLLGARGGTSEMRRLILLPPLARATTRFLPFLTTKLECLPPLRSHWMARIDKEQS